MNSFRSIFTLFFFVAAFNLFGCVGHHIEINQGATQATVEKALGKPRGFHRRWMAQGEVREIWVYHKRGLWNHLYPNTRIVVFSNGTVVAENPLDPYARLKTAKSKQ